MNLFAIWAFKSWSIRRIHSQTASIHPGSYKHLVQQDEGGGIVVDKNGSWVVAGLFSLIGFPNTALSVVGTQGKPEGRHWKNKSCGFNKMYCLKGRMLLMIA